MQQRTRHWSSRSIGVFAIALISAMAVAGGVASAQTWLDQDVGNVGISASPHTVTNGVWTVQGAGADIWGTVDSFHFVYQQLSGDGQIIAKVDSVQNTNTFAKAGLMMRDGITAGAAHVILDLRPLGVGTEFMKRATANGSTTFVATTAVAAPYWLKLVRSGDTFAGWQSTDGIAWTLIGSTTTTMGTTLDVGVVVCSHDTTQLNTSTFESVFLNSFSSPPSSYNAISDSTVRAPGTAPTIGAAGSIFNDAAFGSPILRVTDKNTRPGYVNKSYHMPSNSHLNVWNANSTYFYVQSTDGSTFPLKFNAATMTTSRFAAGSSSDPGDGGYAFFFNAEPQFSQTDPNKIYGIQSAAPLQVRYFDFSNFNTTTYPTLLDLATVDTSLPTGATVGGIVSGGSPENLIAFFSGTGQDKHHDVVWFPVANPDSAHWKLLNTCQATINGVPTNITFRFLLHSAAIDRSGRYVFLDPANPDPMHPDPCDALTGTSQVYIWDTATNLITSMTEAMHPHGHDATGYGYWINQDCCSGGEAWDAAQWQFRSLASLSSPSDLITPTLRQQTGQEVVFGADHESWNNANSSANALVPAFMGTYRYCFDCSPETAPWRAWDNEIIGIDTTHAGSATTVWRFAHHLSDVGADNAGPPSAGFYYEPIADVSPNGLWITFTSNWSKTLGTDTWTTDGSVTHRQDVFLLQLTPATGSGGGGGGGGTQNVVWANVVDATATGNTIQKTSGCDGCQDAGGVSQQTIASGTGSFTFTATTSGTLSPSMYVGLGNGLSSPPTSGQYAYAITISPNNTCDIREFDTWKADCTWTSSDTFKIAIESDGKVHFYKNATSLFISTTTPNTYPYLLGTTLFVNGVAVNNAVITTP